MVGWSWHGDTTIEVVPVGLEKTKKYSIVDLYLQENKDRDVLKATPFVSVQKETRQG